MFMYGRINFNLIDTTPGQTNAFAPSAGFKGDYLPHMRERFNTDPGVRQHIFFAASMLRRKDVKDPQFTGPYAEKAVALCREVYQ